MILKRFAGPLGALLIVGTIAAAAIFAGATQASATRARALRPQAADGRSVPAGAPVNPEQLVGEMVANEIKAEKATDSFWEYRQTTRDGAKSKVEEIVETSEGNLARVIARDGHSFTPRESLTEEARVRNVASNPREWQRSQKDVEEDTKKANEFLRMLPRAFDFSYAGEKDGNVDLLATPNPAFHPSRREAEVFHHMEGNVWINVAQRRMVRIDGRLISPVDFGGGILGHLDKGGTFVVAQQEVAPGHWELTELDVHMTGKALIFKTISVQQQQSCTDFREVANPMTLEEAAKLLTAPDRTFDQRAGARGSGAKKKSGA